MRPPSRPARRETLHPHRLPVLHPSIRHLERGSQILRCVDGLEVDVLDRWGVDRAGCECGAWGYYPGACVVALFTGIGCSRIIIGTTCEFNFGLLRDLSSDGVSRFDVLEKVFGAV
jgi:hypothetical protein